MLRKHLNTIDQSFYTNDHVPFYAWQCVTLELKHRDVDLVIKDDKDMDDFLMVLIEAMETVDGNRGSYKVVEEMALDQKIKLRVSQDPYKRSIK